MLFFSPSRQVLESFDDWQFFMGESCNVDGMVALLNYREDGVTPYMLFFRDGLIEEKQVSTFPARIRRLCFCDVSVEHC